ncbi:MAG TPA: type VI secretion system tip protein VgrG, partial [Sorangium sp.]|nr:type VI secretion system tip protein VgrG [Sorangium sp.]
STPVADDKGKTRIDEQEGKLVAKRRLQAKRSSALTFSFESNAYGVTPGMLVGIAEHPNPLLGDGKQLLLTEIVFSGSPNSEWHFQCKAATAAVHFRPALDTPKPRVMGVESATVVGPPGEEIHTDEFGRVRVHFHWDRESNMDDNSSCWIHVSQPWGGTGFGGMNIPRVGQEVIVSFLGGDPDRPVIVGRVFTGVQKVPYKLPDNKTQSGWRTNSSPGGGGFNEIMFEDMKGSELMYVQAEKDRTRLTKNDEDITVGHNRTKHIVNDESTQVDRDRTELVKRDETITIGQDRKEKVVRDEQIIIGQDRAENVARDEQITIGNDRTEAVGNNESIMVGANRSRTVGINESVMVGVNQSITVGASQSTNVGASKSTTVGATSTEKVALAKSTMVGASYSIMVGGMMSTKVGISNSEQVLVNKTVKAGSNITQKAGSTMVLDAGDKIAIVCGAATIVVESSGKVTVNGTELVHVASDKVSIDSKGTVVVKSSGKATIDASGSLKILGSVIDLN